MFHKIILISVSIALFVSCTSVEPPAVPEEAVDQTDTKVSIESADEDVVLVSDILYWSSPLDFEIILDRKSPVPIYTTPRMKVKTKSASPPDEAVSDEYEPPVVTETENENKTESHSFLEPILNPEKKEVIPEKPVEPVVPEKMTETTQLLAAPVKAVVSGDIKNESTESDLIQEYEKTAVREVYILECDTEGWLLDEITDVNGNASDRLKYSGREYAGGRTLFSFYPYSTGVFRIKLRKPDFSTGKTIKRILELQVVLSLETEELNEDEEVAVPVEETEEYEEQSTMAENLPEASVTEIAADAAGIIAAADSLESAGDCSGAAELLQKGLEVAQWNELDSLYFRLGRLYETCSAVRDERAAINVYKQIIDYYPVSNYWIEAKERIAYLQRNFIYIR